MFLVRLGKTLRGCGNDLLIFKFKYLVRPMNLWQKIKLGFGLAITGLISILGLLLLRSGNKRQDAKHKAQNAERDLRAVEKQAQESRNVAKAQNQARKENAKAEQKRREIPKQQRRTGKFGSADRLQQ
jgi:hypothetical protein